MQITNETFFLDISHHQGNNPNLAQAKAEGIMGVIAKATEGSGFVDNKFHYNLERSLNLGLEFAAYHYQRAGISAAEQVANIRRVVPRDVPVIPDVEGNSGNTALTFDIIRLLKDNGYKVPMLYLPRWYWLQIGQPNLANLPPLWSSRYPDNVRGGIKDEYDDVPASYWYGYGNQSVVALQFTSAGNAGGYGPLDINAFRGTKSQFHALLHGEDPDAMTPQQAEMLQRVEQKLDQLANPIVSTWQAMFFGGGENPLTRGLVYETKDAMSMLANLQNGMGSLGSLMQDIRDEQINDNEPPSSDV